MFGICETTSGLLFPVQGSPLQEEIVESPSLEILRTEMDTVQSSFI